MSVLAIEYRYPARHKTQHKIHRTHLASHIPHSTYHVTLGTPNSKHQSHHTSHIAHRTSHITHYIYFFTILLGQWRQHSANILLIRVQLPSALAATSSTSSTTSSPLSPPLAPCEKRSQSDIRISTTMTTHALLHCLLSDALTLCLPDKRGQVHPPLATIRLPLPNTECRTHWWTHCTKNRFMLLFNLACRCEWATWWP